MNSNGLRRTHCEEGDNDHQSTAAEEATEQQFAGALFVVEFFFQDITHCLVAGSRCGMKFDARFRRLG